jgi:methylase of polypeptide subunit release factors
MEAITVERPAERSHRATIRDRAGVVTFTAADRALLALGRELKASGYRFTAITPATHRLVNGRKPTSSAGLPDIFGWSRPFRARDLPAHQIELLAQAGALHKSAALLRSGVRFASLGHQLFVHSAFPTEQSDAVFFGPDTYRFARLIAHSLPRAKIRRILDIGAGSGAGGLHAASLLANAAPSLVLSDVNRQALHFSLVNAALNGVHDVAIVESNLFDRIDGLFDFIIANPPYLVDPLKRLYRHGGGPFGSGLSLKIVDQAIDRLAPGGRLVLYTGAAIVAGIDGFHNALKACLTPRSVRWKYEEIDPDVFAEELKCPPYDRADRIAVVGVTLDRAG